MKIKKKGIFSIFLSIIILFGMLIQTSIPVSAQGNNSEKTEIKITDFSIEHKDGTTGNTYAWWEEFKLKMNWDASMYQNNLREGDYFDVKLPDKMKFPTNSAATHFDISAPDGSVLAKAVVTPNKNGGGKLRVTFTNYVESRSNIKGTMWLAATFYGEKITYGGQNVFDITVNGKVSRITVPSITGPTKPNNEILGKWSESTDSETEALWNLRINHKKGTYPNVVIKDSLYTYDDNLQGMHYIPGTFKLEEVEYNEYGDTIRTLSTTDISDKIKFNRDKTSFTYNLGDVNGKQYRLRYRSTYVPGVKLGNKANIKSKTDNFTTTSTYQNASSGGNGQGDLLGKIKIIKVDAENTEIKLAGARFKITRISDGKTFDITTDSNGEAISERLIPGDYKLQEIVAPPGYESDSTEYTVTVSSEKATIQTIKNEPVKTSVSVNKKWVGKKQDSVTVHLIADNVDTGKSATLNKANHWQHTFGNLRKFNSDGTEIKYTIKEDIPNGYENKITGSQKNGYTITNTNVEKIAIPVTKTWVGKAADKVRVRLLANGKEISYKDLSSANNWQHTFENYPKYDKDGKEIKYTVKEDKIAGYKAEITGDIKTGFTIKNSNIEKVSIPIVKQWVGKSTDKVEVKLLADGIEKAMVTLTAATDWKHTFKDLPKYDEKDGHEITYTISEVKVDGYTTGISGTAKDGFTITNTITGKVSVPVTKTWVGKEGTSAKIHLYADGRKLDSVTLSKANKWQHTFTNLEKYKDGKEIKYTIKEDVIENYKSEITGDMTLGFTVKNTNTEKLSIPIVKQWVGESTDKVEVKLLADGIEKATVTLTAATDWKHTFKDLPKYDEKDGHEITYTISEVKVDGYTTGISGTAKDGFTITNTITGKVSVPVTKRWVGEAGDSVTVNLYADGKKIATQKLSKANNWQYTFGDLPQYKDGKEIIYTVEEEKISGYTVTVTGDAKNGFVITNTKDIPNKPSTPKHNLPKSGDEGNLSMYVGLVLVSAGLLLLLGIRRRKNGK